MSGLCCGQGAQTFDYFMKLLFDQNVSYRIVGKLKDIFQDCSQVKIAGLEIR